MITDIDAGLLEKIADLTGKPVGAFNIRKAIRLAVSKSIDEGIVTEDLADGGKAYSTSEVGDWIASRIRKGGE